MSAWKCTTGLFRLPRGVGTRTTKPWRPNGRPMCVPCCTNGRPRRRTTRSVTVSTSNGVPRPRWISSYPSTTGCANRWRRPRNNDRRRRRPTPATRRPDDSTAVCRANKSSRYPLDPALALHRPWMGPATTIRSIGFTVLRLLHRKTEAVRS